jgi:hypothetical protein
LQRKEVLQAGKIPTIGRVPAIGKGPVREGAALKLHTNAFTLEELNLLIEALNKNFSIRATINTSKREKAQYILYISKNQLQLVRSKRSYA